MNLKITLSIVLVLGLGLFCFSLFSIFDSYKIDLMDFGSGLIVASLPILLFFSVREINSVHDLINKTTLSKKAIFLYSNLVWLLLIPGTLWYYWYRSIRGDFPTYADSIWIPISGQIEVFLMLLIPLNLFLFITTYKATLPTKLITIPAHYNGKRLFWEIFFGFWIVLNILFLVLFIMDGDHVSIIVNLFFTYILLILRSGKINWDLRSV